MKRLVLFIGTIITMYSCKSDSEKQADKYVDSMMIKVENNQKIIDSLITVVHERNKEIIERNREIIRRNDSLINKIYK